jgi:hypothetical protein
MTWDQIITLIVWPAFAAALIGGWAFWLSRR